VNGGDKDKSRYSRRYSFASERTGYALFIVEISLSRAVCCREPMSCKVDDRINARKSLSASYGLRKITFKHFGMLSPFRQ